MDCFQNHETVGYLRQDGNRGDPLEISHLSSLQKSCTRGCQGGLGEVVDEDIGVNKDSVAGG